MKKMVINGYFDLIQIKLIVNYSEKNILIKKNW